ncbi:hydroxymethylbilane synthase [Bordetella holmesii]|uniref:hydroxymethylbilane synthase n=1 Tax=Bordetella holmesii TaxID=35814 RepID=UPI0002B9E629|nr:hydroxymethylbilane synthase [Bordetella holmesii]AHV91576.1 porphobilinogen deaminase [Bordetella holmesii ATCC 51541]AMD48038.1 porphobilinogen deaminase [Bordetella holmesii F627]AUL19439.1 hydroxymethylbilane synthase [Bordetella holmesii]AUL22777.1 hydroxymethylbilane synthase [Bordetella holmesii]AUL26092.1 hydroxymethylbilane synthase [Bordetella holmesii]
MSLPQRLVIATRASRLAIWQAEHVRDRLRALYPACAVELLTLTTRGDQILDRTLSKVGGKGLFVKELENALLDGRADLAVHSLKDVPVELLSPFVLSAVLERADPRDAFVSNQHESLATLPSAAIVGTSSLRREAQIRAARPDLVVKPLRGNLDTRLGKLDQGEYDAIILAAAGLERIGYGNRIRARLSPEQSLPAAGQGALGIEIRDDRDDLRAWLAPLASPGTAACVSAERAVSRMLGGSCQVPLAAYAELHGPDLRIQALVSSIDGVRRVRSERVGPSGQAEQLGQAVAQDLLDNGAGDILAELLQDPQ